MRSIKYFLFIFFLTINTTFSQPKQFLDLLSGDVQNTMKQFSAQFVDGEAWKQTTVSVSLLKKVEAIFSPLNPRDGDWGSFDTAINANSHVAHDFFDTLETSLSFDVKPKGSNVQPEPLVDFEKPKGVSTDKAYILINAQKKEVEAILKDVLILQMVLRKTRGLHSVLS